MAKLADDIMLRDFFAAQAISGYMRLAENDDEAWAVSGMEFEEYIAAQAYMLADAMIAERKDRS